MTDSLAASLPATPTVRLFRPDYLVWIGIALIVMTAAIQSDILWFLNFVHVLAGVLWTGIDLFMGFVVGPIIRSVDFAARRAIVTRLMPRMLYLMPTLATVTTTAGWFLASRRGYLDLPTPQYWWVVGALAIAGILFVQGTGVLLPVNLKVLFQMRKAEPDAARIGRLMGIYVRVVASQATLQIVIIVIMARFVTGL